jgi:hypothetical protein
MCIGNGIPAIVGRFREQTSKGVMWRDVGLGEWLFDFDVHDDRQRYVSAVLDIAQNPETALRKAREAREFVMERQARGMALLRDQLEAAPSTQSHH